MEVTMQNQPSVDNRNKLYKAAAMALILALLAGFMVFPTRALAQGGNPGGSPDPLPGLPGRARPLLGQVTRVSADQFTLTTRDGAERSFRFDSTTRFIDRDRQPLSSADLKTNVWAAVILG